MDEEITFALTNNSTRFFTTEAIPICPAPLPVRFAFRSSCSMSSSFEGMLSSFEGMQFYEVPRPIKEKFGFRLRPEIATIKIAAILESFSDFDLGSAQRQINLPEVTTTVGSHKISCHLRLRLNKDHNVIAELVYNNGDVRVVLETVFMADYENGTKRRFEDVLCLRKRPETVTIETLVTFFYNASERVEIADFPVGRSDVLLRTSEGSIITYDATHLASASSIFKLLIEGTSENSIIEVYPFDKSTVEITLTFLRGDTPYVLTESQRQKVVEFATEYKIEHIKELFPTQADSNHASSQT
uniref:BTB domain-containing protein n=2 Tax=Panagrellus redivivus TaxID=6233 RepID=A0A7E4WCQ5_PANRE